MSKFDKDLKVGDIITAYHKGYHKVTNIKRRFVLQDEHRRFPKIHPIVGEEYNSIIEYTRVLDSKCNPAIRGKKHLQCDSAYCIRLTTDLIKTRREIEIQQLNNGYDRLLTLLEKK